MFFIHNDNAHIRQGREKRQIGRLLQCAPCLPVPDARRHNVRRRSNRCAVRQCPDENGHKTVPRFAAVNEISGTSMDGVPPVLQHVFNGLQVHFRLT